MERKGKSESQLAQVLIRMTQGAVSVGTASRYPTTVEDPRGGWAGAGGGGAVGVVGVTKGAEGGGSAAGVGGGTVGADGLVARAVEGVVDGVVGGVESVVGGVGGRGVEVVVGVEVALGGGVVGVEVALGGGEGVILCHFCLWPGPFLTAPALAGVCRDRHPGPW